MPIVVAKLSFLILAIYAFGIPAVLATLAVVMCMGAFLALRHN